MNNLYTRQAQTRNIFGVKAIRLLLIVCCCAVLGVMAEHSHGYSGDEQLLDAASKGRTQRVIDLIEAGAGVNKADMVGNTPLHYAASKGNLDMARVLIEAGADANKANLGDRTPLHLAASEGKSDIIRALLAVGVDQTDNKDNMWHKIMEMVLPSDSVDINRTDGFGNTPFDLAVRHGHADAIRVLAGAGANVNKADMDGDTPLHDAALSGNAGTIRVLIEVGADINKVNHDGRTPLHTASSGYNWCWPQPPIEEWQGRSYTIIALIEAGADVNKIDYDDKMPLLKAIHVAACIGDIRMIQALLVAGVDVNDQESENGSTPLHSAVSQGQIDAARVLMKNGADVNKVNKHGWTPLHSAAKGARSGTARALIEAGANVNRADNEGKYPLYYVATRGIGTAETRRILREAGAKRSN